MAETAAMTMTQKIIAIAVTIIIISTVALPVIDDMSEGTRENRSNTNQLYFVADGETITATKNTGSITINGYTFTPNNGDVLLLCNEFYATYNSNYGIVGVKTEDTSFIVSKSVVISNGVATFTKNDDSTVTVSYDSKVLYASDSGNYGAFKTPFYADEDAILYSAPEGTVTNANLTPSSVTIRATGLGTYSDFELFVTGGSTDGFGSIVLNHTDYDKYALIDPAASAITYTDDKGTYTGSFNIMIFAPIKYSVESSMSNLINVIPIILILVPLMMAVRMIVVRRN